MQTTLATITGFLALAAVFAYFGFFHREAGAAHSYRSRIAERTC